MQVFLISHLNLHSSDQYTWASVFWIVSSKMEAHKSYLFMYIMGGAKMMSYHRGMKNKVATVTLGFLNIIIYTVTKIVSLNANLA